MRQGKKKIQSYNSYSNKKDNRANSILRIAPIVFIIAILPLVMRYHTYDTRLSQYAWFSSEGTNQDLFLYYKQVLFVIVSSIMMLAVCSYLYNRKGKVKLPFIFIPLGVYALLAFLSTIFSKNPIFGWLGMMDQFESVFVLLGYCVTVVYIFLFIQEEDIDKIFQGLLFGLLVMNIIGLSQRIDKDIITGDFWTSLIFPQNIWENIEGFSMNFRKGTVYLTLFNPNYVGVYVAFLLPIVGIIFFLRGNIRGIKNIILYSLNIIGLLVCLIGSGSEAGMIGITVSLIFFLVLSWRYIFSNKYLAGGVILFIITGLIFIFGYKIDTIKKFFTPSRHEVSLEKIITDNKIEITYKGNTLLIDYMENDLGSLVLEVVDKDREIMNYVFDEGIDAFVIEDERFEAIRIQLAVYDNRLCIKVIIAGKEWIFTKGEDDSFYYYTRFMKLDKIITAESALFTGYEKFASGRGYIWARTIPMLKRYIVLGSGADTYAVAFPQQDYVGLYNYGYSNAVLTKPHNMYLQMGVQTGVLSVIAFIIVYLIYFIDSLRLYFGRKYKRTLEQYGVAIFIGTISYMIVSLSNDSSITVAPIFWTMMGLGICINYKIKSEKMS